MPVVAVLILFCHVCYKTSGKLAGTKSSLITKIIGLQLVYAILYSLVVYLFEEEATVGTPWIGSTMGHSMNDISASILRGIDNLEHFCTLFSKFSVNYYLS